MIPTAIISVPAFPMNQNGKIDRVALEALAPIPDGVEHSALLEQMSPIEKSVYDVWATEMSVSALDANFFACGGDSITAIRIATKYRALGYPLDLMDLYRAPTVQEQAAILEAKQNVLGSPDVVLRKQERAEYKPFELLRGEVHKAAVMREVVEIGYKAGAVEDAYPCTSYISGLISLAAADRMVRALHSVQLLLMSFSESHSALCFRASSDV
jgi:aryl carrier-like protein